MFKNSYFTLNDTYHTYMIKELISGCIGSHSYLLEKHTKICTCELCKNYLSKSPFIIVKFPVHGNWLVFGLRGSYNKYCFRFIVKGKYYKKIIKYLRKTFNDDELKLFISSLVENYNGLFPRKDIEWIFSSHKKDTYDILVVPFVDLPLYTNLEDRTKKAIVNWRLALGK